MIQSLIQALNSSNNITLPNFGGIMKMGSSYMFNEFLKFNDGKFSKFLQETDGLSKEEANIKIDDFIKEIKTALSATGSFSLNEIGTLNLIDGKIKLELLSISAKGDGKTAPKDKETKKIANNLSIEFTVKEAQQKIKAFKNKQEIIYFTRGDNRKSIIETLNQKLKSLNNIDNAKLDILEASQIKPDKNKDIKHTPIKEGSEKEVKEQVAKESDILKIVIEKEIADNTTPEKEEVITPTQKKEIQTETATLSIKKEDIENTETKEEEDLVALTEGAIKIEKETKQRKKNRIIFWLALICILSGGSIIGYLKQDVIVDWFENPEQLAHNASSNTLVGSELDQHTEKQKIEEELAEQITIEEKKVEQIIKQEIIPEEIENLEGDNQTLDSREEEEVLVEEKIIESEEVTQIENANKANYYSVVGSFSKEKNAKNLLKSLKEEGYNDAIIFQNGNLKSVSLGIFSTINESKKALKQSGRSGWVKNPNNI